MALSNQGPNAPNLLSPPAKQTLVKMAKLDAGESTTFAAFVLPKDAFICGVYTISAGANATQTVSAGFSGAGTELVSTFAPDSTGYAVVTGADTGSAVGTKLTANQTVYFFASAALTNAVYLKVEYYVTQSNQPF